MCTALTCGADTFNALACDQLSFGCAVTTPSKSNSNETLPKNLIGNMILPPTLPVTVIFVLRLADPLTESGVGASPSAKFTFLGCTGSEKSQSYSLLATIVTRVLKSSSTFILSVFWSI